MVGYTFCHNIMGYYWKVVINPNLVLITYNILPKGPENTHTQNIPIKKIGLERKEKKNRVKLINLKSVLSLN